MKYLINFSLETFLLKAHNRRVEGWLSHDAEGAKDFSFLRDNEEGMAVIRRKKSAQLDHLSNLRKNELVVEQTQSKSM